MLTRATEVFVAITLLLLVAVLAYGIYISKHGSQFQKSGSRSGSLLPLRMK